jgi:hypothetical protein
MNKKEIDIIDRMAIYLGEVHFNEGYIVNHNNIKEMIKLCYMDDIAKEVFNRFKKRWNIT